jgi:PAS domain S-box-containing protein
MTVSFEASTLWDSHREAVLGTLAIFGAAILALAILLVQIARRRKAETYLKDSEERLNFAAASGGIGLWQYDIARNELWSSEHCRTMFGLSPECPLTTDVLLRRVHPADRHVASASIRAATYGLLAETMIEFRIVRPDGQVRWIQGRGHSTFDGHGNAIRVSGIFRDLTAYRAAQREARDLSQRILSIQDEERQRIAQELHDSTAQHLAAINLNLMALRGASNPAEKTVPLFADIQGSLIAAMNELRTFTYLLYPQEISRHGLLETLGRYITGFSRRTGLQVKLRITEHLDDLSPTIQHSLLRIVQESLANVHRHASASRVTIKLFRSADRIHLLIADNGVGLKHSPTMGDEENSALPLGVGIPGMAARARQLGGKLDVRSKPTGTLVHAVLPLDLAHEVAVLRTVAVGPQNRTHRGGEHKTSADSTGVAQTDPTKTRRWAKAQQQQHQH